MKWLALLMVGVVLGMSGVQAADVPGLKAPLTAVADNYLVIQQKLANDIFDGIPAAADAMKTAMTGDNAKSFDPDFIHAVTQLAATKDLHNARIAFQNVSQDFIATLARDHVSTGELHAVFCPMVKAYWVQTDDKKVENPYYGSSMPDCGEFRQQY